MKAWAGDLTNELPSTHHTRFHCRLTSCILWLRMCEKETVMPLLARFSRSMHFLRHGCWLALTVRAVVHDICHKALHPISAPESVPASSNRLPTVPPSRMKEAESSQLDPGCLHSKAAQCFQHPL